MTVYTVKVVTRGNKNTRWQFADGYGNLYDGLLPTNGNYRVGQELDKDAFSSIRSVRTGQNSVEQVLAIRDAEAASAQNYVNVLTGEVLATTCTEAEFESMMECEF